MGGASRGARATRLRPARVPGWAATQWGRGRGARCKKERKKDRNKERHKERSTPGYEATPPRWSAKCSTFSATGATGARCRAEGQAARAAVRHACSGAPASQPPRQLSTTPPTINHPANYQPPRPTYTAPPTTPPPLRPPRRTPSRRPPPPPRGAPARQGGGVAVLSDCLYKTKHCDDPKGC